jgi:hypothetical protein
MAVLSQREFEKNKTKQKKKKQGETDSVIRI